MAATTAPSPTAPARGAWSLPRAAGLALGAVYLAVGVAGALLTGFSGPHEHVHVLFIVQVNPVHNVAHLGLGAALAIGAVVGVEAARSVDRLLGVVFAALGVVGPFIMGTLMDPIALNGWDNLLHLATAAVLLWAAWALRERPAA